MLSKLIIQNSKNYLNKLNFQINEINFVRRIHLTKSKFTQTNAEENKNDEKQQQETGENQLVNEGKIYAYKDFDLPEKIDMQPVCNLNVLSKINKVRKEGSFIGNLFLGKFDNDFLTFPEVLHTRKEFLALTKQSEMIVRNFKTLLNENDHLEKLTSYRFDYLWQLSISEMVNIFESIGSSLAITPEVIEKSLKNSTETSLNRLSIHPVTDSSIQQLLFKMILHNSLSMATINNSTNNTLKERIYQRANDDPKFRLAFAWSEQSEKFGSLSYIDWTTKAMISNDKKSWLLNGKKSRILKDEYDYYIVYAYTNDFPESSTPTYKEFDGIVALLVPKALIGKSETEIINGIEYETIEFNDVLLPKDDYQILEAEEFGVTAQNIKGIGQICVSAFLIGQCKAVLNHVYSYLIEHRKPLLDSQLIESMLASITQDIYKLEAVNYMVAAMNDAFDSNYMRHMYLEAAACKTLAVESSRNIFLQIQQLYGSNYLFTSPVMDLINILDSFLDTTLHNRLLIGLQGTKIFGQYHHIDVHQVRLAPFYPFTAVKHYIKSYKLSREMPRLTLDLKGYMHPTFRDNGDHLEYCIKKLEYAISATVIKWGKKVTEHQCDLNRLSQMAIDIFALTCVLSRASRSFCDGTRNGDLEVLLARSISMDTFLNVHRIVDEISRSDQHTNDSRNHDVHKRNLRFNGYSAYSPLDKTFF